MSKEVKGLSVGKKALFDAPFSEITNRRSRNYVVWVRKVFGCHDIIRKRRIPEGTTHVKFNKDNIHPIEMRTPSFRNKTGTKKYYLIDIDNKSKKGGQLRYEGSGFEYDPEWLAFMRTGVVKDLSVRAHSKLFDGNTIILMIIGGVIGACATGFILGFF
ncbi:MAG: hypothetical protein ACFFHV_20285 [Promethearchaeota archaeon]